MKLVLDTNIHSDWANPSASLAPDVLRRLETIIAHPHVDLIVPGPMFMEFQWPRDKQERWAERVADRANSIAMLAEDPVVWDLRRLWAELRGEPLGALKLVSGSKDEILATLGAWHPSPLINQATAALKMASKAQAHSLKSKQRPAGKTKEDHRREQREADQRVAEMLTDPTQLQQLLETMVSEPFQQIVKAALVDEGYTEEQALALVRSQQHIFSLVGASDDDVRDAGVAPEMLNGIRGVFDLATFPELDTWEKKQKFMAVWRLLPAELSAAAAREVFTCLDTDPGRAPCFSTYWYMKQRLENQPHRKPRPSDEADLAIVTCVAFADFVTTDGAMSAAYGQEPLFGVVGRLYKRTKLDLLLDAVEAALS